MLCYGIKTLGISLFPAFSAHSASRLVALGRSFAIAVGGDRQKFISHGSVEESFHLFQSDGTSRLGDGNLSSQSGRKRAVTGNCPESAFICEKTVNTEEFY